MSVDSITPKVLHEVADVLAGFNLVGETYEVRVETNGQHGGLTVHLGYYSEAYDHWNEIVVEIPACGAPYERESRSTHDRLLSSSS